MDKYWKYCRDAETRELTGKGNRIYDDDDDDKEDDYNNINEQDYYGVRERKARKDCDACKSNANHSRICRKSFARFAHCSLDDV